MTTGAQILLECLKREGVDTVFGYPGARTLSVHDGLLDEPSIRHVLVRHEQAAAHAADGYARATGKVGVCLTTSGPGATNLVTGIATAHLDSVPLVALTCQVPTTDIGNDAFQEADIVGITRPITKHNAVVTEPEHLPRILREAFHLARTRRPGAVVVDLPSDVLAAPIRATVPETVRLRGYPALPPLSLHQIRKAAELIDRSERPLLYVGGGVVLAGATAQLRALAERGGIPVTHTLMAMGVVDPHSPLAVGMLGMYGAWHANRAVHECDCLIAVGARFDDRVTGRLDAFAPDARVVHIDVDPATIGKIVPADVPIVGDARQVLDLLHGAVTPRVRDAWVGAIAAWRAERPLPRPVRDDLAPHEVVETVAAVGGPKPIVASDVGLSQMWTANYFGFREPRQYLTSGGLGTMGYALPAAVGASFGRPGRPVFAINGDGAFQMNIQELATCSYYDLPVKTVVLNNGTLGMVRQFQDVFLRRRFAATDLGRHVDFCRVAEGFGVPGWRVDRREDLRPALEAAVAAPGPAVIDVEIAPDCYSFPMVPPGRPTVEPIFAPEDWRA